MRTQINSKLALVFLSLALMVACATVPLTGRKQTKLLPETDLVQMSLAAYNDFLSTSEVVETGDDAAMVRRVGGRLSRAVNKVLTESGDADRLKTIQWEFNLVDDPQVNAWAMPGGKVVVYSGLLPVAGDETGLAVVLGHEIAHAIAQHGNERMSQGLLAQTGFAALDIATQNKPDQTRELLFTAAGIGTQLGVMLPFSRLHESEADRLGLIFMAAAGYDPHQAAGFWQRMQSMSGGGQPPQFLSTHPSHETRIRDIEEKYLPEALPYYKPR